MIAAREYRTAYVAPMLGHNMRFLPWPTHEHLGHMVLFIEDGPDCLQNIALRLSVFKALQDKKISSQSRLCAHPREKQHEAEDQMPRDDVGSELGRLEGVVLHKGEGERIERAPGLVADRPEK